MVDFKKPSDVIRFAVQAVEEAEEKEGFVVDMSVFHSHAVTEGKNICIACAGGMAAIKRWNDFEPIYTEHLADLIDFFGKDIDTIRDFEEAIDYFREGRTGLGFSCLGLSQIEGDKFDRLMVPYQPSPEDWAKEMLEMADDLEAGGY